VKAESSGTVRRRGPWRDAADNRDRVLAAAAVAVRREGAGVPMATVAADTGVGVATVYRHFPSREALLSALTQRSFRLVLDAAARAADLDGAGVEAVRRFLDQAVDHGPDLVLPMHGGGPSCASP
jgi:AcrR family transcriptional regulator